MKHKFSANNEKQRHIIFLGAYVVHWGELSVNSVIKLNES